VSHPSPIQPESSSWWSRLSSRQKFGLTVFSIVGFWFLLVQVEPQGPLTCDDVNVIGTVKCARNSECFLVRYMATGNQRTVTTSADKPFDTKYRGVAHLFTHRGLWTGAYHFSFKDSCDAPSNPRLERP
jgi:hypothetical protein